MAGAVGFEPTHAGIKTPCLTAWRRPIKTDKKRPESPKTISMIASHDCFSKQQNLSLN